MSKIYPLPTRPAVTIVILNFISFLPSFSLQVYAFSFLQYTQHTRKARQHATTDTDEELCWDNVPPMKLNSSEVLISKVEAGLDILYPPTDLEKRNAISRTDGYWSYVNQGKQPPKELAYGEFEIPFFAELLDRAAGYYHEWNGSDHNSGWSGKTFADLGSGSGRLILGAATLYPRWALCQGVELLPGLHKFAEENLEKCRIDVYNGINNTHGLKLFVDEAKVSKSGKSFKTGLRSIYGSTFSPVPLRKGDSILDEFESMFDAEKAADEFGGNDNDEEIEYEDNMEIGEDILEPSASEIEKLMENILPLSPVKFTCGSFDDPYIYLGASDCVFCFSSCMPGEATSVISQAVGRCRPGTILITTDYMPPLEGEIKPIEDDVRLSHGQYKLELLESMGKCKSFTFGMPSKIFFLTLSVRNICILFIVTLRISMF